MNVNLFPFQETASKDLCVKLRMAQNNYCQYKQPQVLAFTAPTGSGKTIMMAALIEGVLFGNLYPARPNTIFVWLSDSPELNAQSRMKIEQRADRLTHGQCVTITEADFDQEYLTEGHIYFLNTQKLGVSGNLVKTGDKRRYSIWETLANTVRDKGDKLVVIIDEAHRGADAKSQDKATTIMQKFIKGDEKVNLPPMPVVIGMSATLQRFHKLVESTDSVIYPTVVEPAAVRRSGLLKERIIVSYPESSGANKEMAILQRAVQDWRDKCDSWALYCREQHEAMVHPVLIVQVQNGGGNKITNTDLAECLRHIEQYGNVTLEQGQVVHTFGEHMDVRAGERVIEYLPPSQIDGDKNVRIVFFKENLSTGWDCPRAETMMSFRPAQDATYIAQLLGRMVRTPLHRRISFDESLNDVHLFLPYFDRKTVQSVVDHLQSAEGSELTAIIETETIDNPVSITVSTEAMERPHASTDDSINYFDGFDNPDEFRAVSETKVQEPPTGSTPSEPSAAGEQPATTQQQTTERQMPEPSEQQDVERKSPPEQNDLFNHSGSAHTAKRQTNRPINHTSREKIRRFINNLALSGYRVREKQLNKSFIPVLLDLLQLLQQHAVDKDLYECEREKFASDIHSYIQRLKENKKYDKLSKDISRLRMLTEIYDPFGERVENITQSDFLSTTETDIERQLGLAETQKLGNHGVSKTYRRLYGSPDNRLKAKIDVILFVTDDDCMKTLESYAKQRFHDINDKYRRTVATAYSNHDIYQPHALRERYNKLVRDSGKITKLTFELPHSIQLTAYQPDNQRYFAYNNHLYMDKKSGQVVLPLNQWERKTLEAESKRSDFVCFIRNDARKSWALSLYYTLNNEAKAFYPDFLIVRRDTKQAGQYIVDILEPHRGDTSDNLGKAKALAQYAQDNPVLGRVQLIREVTVAGVKKLKRLDMAKSSVREQILYRIANLEELDHLFNTEGECD